MNRNFRELNGYFCMFSIRRQAGSYKIGNSHIFFLDQFS